MNRFEGKVAVVTGAASGIGRAVTERLTSEGASVYGVDVNSEGLAEVETRIKDAGGTIQVGTHDITSRANCFEAVESAVGSFGRLDVLANVAGIVQFHHTPEMPEEAWRLLHAVNLDAPFFLSQAAIPHLLETSGNIVNIASNAGLMGQAYTAAYCSSKAGLINMTRALAIEYINTGMRVNVVAPGGVATNLTKTVKFPGEIDFELIKRYSGLRGFSDPEEIAAAVAYVASDEAKSVHGSIFSVDGGITAG